MRSELQIFKKNQDSLAGIFRDLNHVRCSTLHYCNYGLLRSTLLTLIPPVTPYKMLLLPLLQLFLLILLEIVNKCIVYRKFFKCFFSASSFEPHNTRTYERSSFIFARCPSHVFRVRYVMFVVSYYSTYRLYPPGTSAFFHSKTCWSPFDLEHSDPSQAFWYAMLFLFFSFVTVSCAQSLPIGHTHSKLPVDGLSTLRQFSCCSTLRCEIRYPGT